MTSSSSSLKIFASVAIITLIGGYGLSKLYNNNKFHKPKRENYDYDYDYEYDDYEYDDYYDCEFSDDDTEKVVITSTKKSLTSSDYTYTNNTTNSSNTLVVSKTSKNSSHHKPSISKKHYILIEDLIMSITKKQNQAIYFRKKYHKNLNGILKQIDDMREKICVTEGEHLKNIHKLLDEIENYHRNHKKNHENHEKNEKNEKNLDESYTKELEKQVTQEEAYLETELKVLQTDLGMLMWKYEELENYASKEWENSQLEIKQLREKLMNNATRLSKMKPNKY